MINKKSIENQCQFLRRKKAQTVITDEGRAPGIKKGVNEKHLQQPGKGIIDENLKKDNKNNMHIPLVSIQTSAKTKQTDLSDIKSQTDQEQQVTLLIANLGRLPLEYSSESE